MKRSRSAVASLCLSLVLSPLAVSLQAWAALPNKAASLPNNNNTATPIGTVESTGTILINGRAAQGRNVLWDGELLQAAPGANAAVNLEALGQLTLTGGSLVRVATAANAGQQQRRTLVASVYNGQIELELKPAASAYLEAAGKTWLASGNARLSLGVRDGAATLKTTQGYTGEMGSFALSLPSLQGARTALPTAKLDAQATGRDSLLRSIKLVTNRGGGEMAQPVRLYANTKAGMIGMIDSSGTVKINGREARRQELLWDGEILQAPANAAAQVSLAGLGQVNLAKGSVVKLTTANASANSERRVLAASVLQGEINIKLQPEIAAYVEANGKAFAAEAGSRFRLDGREAKAIVEVWQGNVREIGSWMVELSTEVMDQAAHLNAGPRQYNIRPLAESSQPGSYLMNVRPQSTQHLRFLVTDMTGKAAAGVPVVFALNAAEAELGGKPVGMLGEGANAGKYFETKTDVRGVAVVPFNAGSAGGSTSLSAAVRGTNSANANVVVVDDDDKFWTKRNAIPVFIAAAGMITAGIVILATRDDRLPIKGTGSTQIVP